MLITSGTAWQSKDRTNTRVWVDRSFMWPMVHWNEEWEWSWLWWTGASSSVPKTSLLLQGSEPAVPLPQSSLWISLCSAKTVRVACSKCHGSYTVRISASFWTLNFMFLGAWIDDWCGRRLLCFLLPLIPTDLLATSCLVTPYTVS